jgi:hypothetical protein
MIRLAVSYDLAGADIPPSTDVGENGNRESFPDRTSPIREDPIRIHLNPVVKGGHDDIP